MDAGVVGDTLSEIAERVSALRVSGDKGSSITESIKHHLMTIKEVAASKLEHGDATRNWLRAVTDVVTDLLDLVEDAALLPKRNKIASLFSRCDLALLFQLKQIEKRLREVGADAKKLSEANGQEIEIVGRRDDKEKILNWILSEENVEGPVSVTTIQGMEGIGKTKLAKCICDDERVKSHFNLIIWIEDIRDESYAESVVKRMIKLATNEKKLEDKASVVTGENLSLGEAIKGRRFLLVLDDLQNASAEEWKKLLQLLEEVATPSGAALLVTTPSVIAALFIYSPRSTYSLGILNDDDSWSLFEQVAGRGGGGLTLSDCKIIQVLKEMVRVCMGVPIAILTMARLVRLKSPEEIAESAIDELKDEFKQEMQMIYYYELPSWHLKQCFAYSSLIFSSGYEKVLDSVKAETLIRLWMAEGFLGPVNSSSPLQPEDIGDRCMREFEDRSIFRFSTYETKHRILLSCSMQANSHSPTTFVASDDNLLMDNPDKDVKKSVRRVSVTSDLDFSKGIPKPLLENATQLRTILFPASKGSRVPHELILSWSACEAICSTFKRLRVLILQDLGMKALPASIGKLKSLRYLDLSYNNMKKLPDCIGELKHLQTLILSHCHELTELPNDVNYFVSLRHLELEECLHLTHMPSALKVLTSLRTLSHFVASSTSKKNSQTGGLWELVDMNNLRGELEILHLERLSKELGPYGRNYLNGKQNLRGLTLRWNHVHNKRHDNDIDDDSESLRYLEPHPNLEALSIVGYEGIKFLDWLSSLVNLVKFSLYNCSKCKRLPPLNRLPKLETLQIQRLDSLEYIIDNHGNQPEESFFPSLKELKISDCPNLTSWWEGRSHNNAKFHSISKLEVLYCPKLDCIPLYPDLDEELVLVSSSLKPLLDTLGYRAASTSISRTDSDSEISLPLSDLREFTIASVDVQSNTLPEGWLKNFTGLWRLDIRACKGLKSLMTGIKHLTSLYELHIENCTEADLPSGEWAEGLKDLCYLYIKEMPDLKSLPEGIEHLSSLAELTIDSCPELTTLTEGVSQLKNLTSLSLEECNKLSSLPQGLSNVTSLSELRIRNCRKLFPRCQRETGDDWPQIKNIKDVFISDTSEYYE